MRHNVMRTMMMRMVVRLPKARMAANMTLQEDQLAS